MIWLSFYFKRCLKRERVTALSRGNACSQRKSSLACLPRVALPPPPSSRARSLTHTQAPQAADIVARNRTTAPLSPFLDTMAPSKKNAAAAKPEDFGLSESEVRSMLIGRDGQLSRDFEAVLTKLFISFLEAPTDRALSLEKLKEFSRICNDGTPFSDNEIKEIQTYFQCDENKGLTLKGFKDMYHTQSSAEPMETWKDMKKLG